MKMELPHRRDDPVNDMHKNFTWYLPVSALEIVLVSLPPPLVPSVPLLTTAADGGRYGSGWIWGSSWHLGGRLKSETEHQSGQDGTRG